jgi:HrpA-like RNA helicase
MLLPLTCCCYLHTSCTTDVGGYGIGSAASVAQRRQALQEERQRRRRRTEALARASASLKEQQLSKKRLPKYQEMQALRASLPMAEARAEVLRAVRDHQVVIVSSRWRMVMAI